MKVVFLNVGQGDAIYIETPSGNKIIVDSGPDKSILREIADFIPFYENIIDIALVTNPDKDHYFGFIPLSNKYKFNFFMEPGTISSSTSYADLKKGLSEIKIVLPKRGDKIKLDEDIYLEILFPERDVSSLKINDGSIVAKLYYKNTSFLLTGDSTKKIEKYLVGLDGQFLVSDVVKIAHHGSNTSSDRDFICKTKAKYAVISAGLKNRYNHPHKETIETLDYCGIPILETSKKGNVVFKSNGFDVWTSD